MADPNPFTEFFNQNRHLSTKGRLKVAADRINKSQITGDLIALRQKLAELDPLNISGLGRVVQEIPYNPISGPSVNSQILARRGQTGLVPGHSGATRSVSTKHTDIFGNEILVQPFLSKIIDHNVIRRSRPTTSNTFSPFTGGSFQEELRKQQERRNNPRGINLSKPNLSRIFHNGKLVTTLGRTNRQRFQHTNVPFGVIRNPNFDAPDVFQNIEVEEISGFFFPKGTLDQLSSDEFALLDTARFNRDAGSIFPFLSPESTIFSPDIRRRDPTLFDAVIELERARQFREERRAKSKGKGIGSVFKSLTGGDPSKDIEKRIIAAAERFKSIQESLTRGDSIEAQRLKRLDKLAPGAQEAERRKRREDNKKLAENLSDKAATSSGVTSSPVSNGGVNSGIQIKV